MNVKEQLKEGLVTKNPVLVQLLGMCSTMAITTTLFNGLGMGISVTAVMLLATAVPWPIQKLILDPLGLGYMQTILFFLDEVYISAVREIFMISPVWTILLDIHSVQIVTELHHMVYTCVGIVHIVRIFVDGLYIFNLYPDDASFAAPLENKTLVISVTGIETE